MSNTTISISTKLTPLQIAEAFCGLGSDEMAEFLGHCKTISDEWQSGFGIYGQALYVEQEAPPKTPGGEFIMAFASPWFLHTLNVIEGA